MYEKFSNNVAKVKQCNAANMSIYKLQSLC